MNHPPAQSAATCTSMTYSVPGLTTQGMYLRALEKMWQVKEPQTNSVAWDMKRPTMAKTTFPSRTYGQALRFLVWAISSDLILYHLKMLPTYPETTSFVSSSPNPVLTHLRL